MSLRFLIASNALLMSSAYRKRVDDASLSGMRVDEGPSPLPVPPDTTVSGCKCKSQCGATAWDTFACDWCRVEDGCESGSDDVFGRWDYCVYPELKDWESLTHEEKTAKLWGELSATQGKSGPVHNILGTVTQIIGESMRTTFDHHWDVLPVPRTKVIHAQGAHCEFRLDIQEDSPFTGLLGSGSQIGIVRMGSATPLGVDIFPGMGIKFLRSGVHSANFVALRPTGPGGSFNYFGTSFTNHVAPPAALQAIMKFDQASDCTNMVGLSDVCSYTQDGTLVDEPVFPFEIVFEPTGEVAFPDKKMSDAELLKQLASIEVGTKLFRVTAKPSPSEAAVEIGSLTTTSQCIQSEFGDLHMSFRHQRMEEDFVLRPDWLSGAAENGCKPKAEDSSKWKCPGVW